MIALWSVLAAAGPPQPLDDAALPAFPDIEGKVRERCTLTWLSEEDGQHRVLSLDGCDEPFQAAVRSKLWQWAWRTARAERSEALEPSWALLTGLAGAPQGLLSSWEVRFDRRRPHDEPKVELVALPVVQVRRASDVELPEGCELLLHVDDQGRASRVQARQCPEEVRASVEGDLMTWTFEPLVVEGAPRRFAVAVAGAARRP